MIERFGRRNIFLSIVALGVIVAAFILKTEGSPRDIFTHNTTDLLVTETTRAHTTRDTDNDGVPDWKEVLEGTNPQNPNTFDIEGGDSAYIENKDEYKTITSLQGETTQTLTEQIGRGVFGEYMYARVGEAPNFSSVDELLAHITNQTFETTQPNIYTKNDFTVVNTNRSTLLSYADSMRALDNSYTDEQLTQASVKIVQTFVATGDPETGEINEDIVNKEIDQGLLLYDEIIGSLRGVAVPDNILNEHINLTNSFAGIKWSLEQLKKTNSDPARALIGLQSFPEYASLIDSMYKAIVRKLELEGVPL